MEIAALQNKLTTTEKMLYFFVLLSAMLVFSVFLLAIAYFRIENKTILVPALREEMTISKKGVSSSYLEEMSLLFLSNLLDLSPSDVAHKRELILKFTSNNDHQYFSEIKEYFVNAENDYKRFGLTTYFTAKNLEIDVNNLTVIAHGILTSSWGRSGYSSESEDYRLEFDWYGGVLRLKSFERILTDDKAAKAKAKEIKANKLLNIDVEDQNKGDKK